MATGQSCDLVTATASLQKCREKLLETNARNSLLNFKINAKSRVVRIFGTSIEGLQDLVFRQKVVGFDFVLPLNEDELASRNLDREEAEKVNQDPERCSKERGVPVNFDLPLKKSKFNANCYKGNKEIEELSTAYSVL